MQHNRYNKNRRLSQLLAVKKALSYFPKSMREVSKELAIERSSVCWYIGKLRKKGEVQIHHNGLCSTTGYKVHYYSANPFISQHPPQLNLQFVNNDY